VLSGCLLVASFAAAPVNTSFAHPLSGDPLLDRTTVLSTPRFNATWPTSGIITTYFGEVGPLAPHGHSGLDIAAPTDTTIVAADEGEVLKAYWNQDGYGGLIVIGHPSDYETWYGHLDRFSVQKGDHVTRGQKIGLMGSTGLSTGSHLHFEVRQDGQVRDPLDFLSEAALERAVL
jgi:murein DD-endopeptidase MepM/ murein hydrolase activator NlpD